MRSQLVRKLQLTSLTILHSNVILKILGNQNYMLRQALSIMDPQCWSDDVCVSWSSITVASTSDKPPSKRKVHVWFTILEIWVHWLFCRIDEAERGGR